MARLIFYKVMNNPTEKKCTKCGEVKDLSMFNKDKRGLYGHNPRCRLCYKSYSKVYRETNKDKIKAYRETNKDKIKYYLNNNKDKIKARHKAYRETNKDKLKAQRKLYNEANKHKIKAYINNNKDKIREYNKKISKNLTDTYVAGILGIPTHDCPKELIELKRAQLKLRRECLK